MGQPTYAAIECQETIIVTDRINAIFKTFRDKKYNLTIYFSSKDIPVTVGFDTEQERDDLYDALKLAMDVVNIEP